MKQSPTVKQIVQQADNKGLVEPDIKNLPPNVANALRSMIAGERPSPALSPDDITRLGETIFHWDPAYGRPMLHYQAPVAKKRSIPGETSAAPTDLRTVSKDLIEQIGLSPHKAVRVEAVVHWPIGFTREDLSHWGQLSDEELETVWDFIAREYGFYTTGTRYAAP